MDDDFYNDNEDDDDDDVGDKLQMDFDPNSKMYNEFSLDTLDLDETPFPVYMQQLFPDKKKIEVIDHGDEERGNWDSQFEYLLSCIGYAVGLGNIWRFPSKVYNGGGGAFLLPYLSFCLLLGIPMMLLEMGLGQFCGQGCTKAFECVPIFFGQGWSIFIIALGMLICYSIVIAWCFVYLFFSFKTIIPWTVCSNPYNTQFCLDVKSALVNKTNSSYESSSIQFWNFYVTGQRKLDGSYYLIGEPLGAPMLATSLALLVVLGLAAGIIMFGVKVSGKVIYVTVIFPYIAILQFIILGCTLPGALNGIKFYLYPEPAKLLDPMITLSALEQLLFSSGIGTGGIITMASFNRFRDHIYRNVLIVVLTDFVTSFVSGFATFPILGYMSYRSGKEIKDLLPSDSSLFFITYPEALSTLPNANLWSILFMFMAIMLGIDSLFVLMEAVIMGISDFWPILHKKRNRIILTVFICMLTFSTCLVLVTPGGCNWLNLYDFRISPFVLTFAAILEMVTITWIYGIDQFLCDLEIMTRIKLNRYLGMIGCFLVPIAIGVVMVFGAINSGPVEIHGDIFPKWTQYLAWIVIFAILSPVPIGMCYILVKYKLKFPGYKNLDYLKECFNPPPTWGPRLKRYWVDSDFYSKKLLKYKNDQKFIMSLAKSENMDKLIYKSEKRIIYKP